MAVVAGSADLQRRRRAVRFAREERACACDSGARRAGSDGVDARTERPCTGSRRARRLRTQCTGGKTAGNRRPAARIDWMSEDEQRAVASAFDPNRLDAAFYQNPYPVYAALRNFDPVHRCPDGTYFLSRYADL